jgi:hypothetical protein
VRASSLFGFALGGWIQLQHGLTKAQTLSYEHYYPYGGTAIIAGKDKTQAQQKRYRYTNKERDDSGGLWYHSRLAILFKFNRLPLASKSLVDCWVSVPRLLFGWMARVCCQPLLFA